MFVKILGISVLAVVLFAAIMLLYARGAVFEHLDPQHRAGLAWSVLAAAGACLVISVGLSALLAHLVVRPMAQLRAAAERIGEGDFAGRASVAGDDEVGALAGAFNRMAGRLADSHREVDEKEAARVRLLERLVESQEAERKHIARELHDHVGQSLMALLLSVQNDCQYHDRPDSCCGDLERRLRELGDEIHHLAWGMRPPVLDDFGLCSALARYLDDLSRQSGLEIDYQCECPAELGRLSEGMEVALYRIAQESVTNVLRHAEAGRASVVVVHQPDHVTLVVEDDGCGFDPAAVGGNNGRLGLTGIRERAALLGGACTIQSKPGGGTTVHVRIPLAKEKPCPSVS
jgi:signal transduction histidine kinase